MADPVGSASHPGSPSTDRRAGTTSSETIPDAARVPRVVRLTESLWSTGRDVRLAALIDSPRAFWSTYPESARLGEHEWRARASSEHPFWLALDGERPLGTVGLYRPDGMPDDEVALVAMWVATVARGSGVAQALVRTALGQARSDGRRRVLLEVAHENRRAWAFYERCGFRATGRVGRMPWDPSVTEEEMVLDLADVTGHSR
ncbi:MAG: GNAT family N-acetyltransferase [Dermatophilaceae bacterium]